MKKLLLLAALLCGITMNVKADPEELTFTVEIVDNGGTNPSLPKSPIELPQATLDGHVLTFTSSHADYTLTLLDEDGDEAYTVFVPAATTTVVLPSTLTGLFELQLYPGGSYYFSGEIVL
jgi:hypothetical protein